MALNHNEISSLIWNVADDVLRGLFKPHEYGDIVLPFVVLRRLDCTLEKDKDLAISLYNEYKTQVEDPSRIILGKIKTTFFNHSNYDLNRLRHDPANVMINFNNYLSGYSENVLEIVDNFQLEKPIEKLNKNNRLFEFIEKFSEINLHPDIVSNHQMGQIFEELLRKFSEMSNETSGEHYTPRDVVKLLVSMVFSQDSDNLQGEGKVRSIFDPCCGTGGMLTIGKEWVHGNINDKVEFRLLGQELNPQTYSICKSDMMITAEDPENIRQGSSLSEDRFQGDKFDYMLTNPPYGVSWKSEKDFVKTESENPNGRFSVGIPRSSDGQLLFLQHMISKMESKGSRIGIVLNGSPMFTGDAGSGESEIRKWIIENDMLECIVSLPNKLFFNTGIPTFLWIVTNKKSEERKGKVQLIDGSQLYSSMRRNLGEKSKEISVEGQNIIIKTYIDFVESNICQIHDKEFFGYTKVTIEQPLEKDGNILTNKQGEVKPDTKKRDYEKIPLSENIEDYFEREVKPHLTDSWVDLSNNKVGYEINFTKYFYKYKSLRSLDEITKDLLKLEEDSENLLRKIIE
jgi:type I restriction enzyme M protein